MQNVFGAELVRLREGAGLTLRQLAEQLDVDHTSLSHIESGRRKPAKPLLGQLAQFFHADLTTMSLRAGRVPDSILEILQERPQESIKALQSVADRKPSRRGRWFHSVDEILPLLDLTLALPGLDSYDREPFAKHISAGKNTSIYSAHSYHTKVPYQGIIPYIEHYTEPGDVVLDPFCGSGMTGVAAILSGRDAILYDISPAAVHIARNYTTPCDASKLESAYAQLVSRLERTEEQLYSTVCDRCGSEGLIAYTVFTDVLECSNCAADISVWNCGRGPDGKLQSFVTCAQCDESHKRRSLRWRRSEPCLVNFKCLNQCSGSRIERPPSDDDLRIISKIGVSEPPDWIPSKPFGPEWEMWRRGHVDRGITDVQHFFTPRNLYALSAIRARIEDCPDPQLKAALSFAFTGCVNRASKRYQWNHKRPTNVLSGTLYVSSLFYEFNVFGLFERKVRAAVRLFRSTAAADGRAAVALGSATELDDVPDDSVDYVFTDPPFGSNIFYADCSLLWEAWLDEYTDPKQEIVVSRSRASEHGGKTIEDYGNLLTEALREIRRVLKPNRWASIVFNNSSSAVWETVRQACVDAGFTLGSTVMFDKRQRSFKRLKGAQGKEKVANYDVVLNLRKAPPVIAVTPSASQSEARIIEVLRKHLNGLSEDATDERSTAFLHSLAAQEAMSAHLDLAPIDLGLFAQLLQREFKLADAGWYVGDPIATESSAIVARSDTPRKVADGQLV